MAQTKEINLNVLPEEIKKELLDFYEYLVTKYGKQRLERKSPTKDKNAFFESVKMHSLKLPGGYKFNREELHER